MNPLTYGFFQFHFLTFSRSHILLFLLFVSCTRSVSVDDDTLSKSVKWMWEQQSEDGGWHSNTHAVLRDGRVLTPYILFHLFQLPQENIRHNGKEIESAIAFITREMRNALNAEGTSLKDYPNYSAAYALRVLNITRRDTQLQKIIINYLLAQQFTEQRGFDTMHLAYGGWGYGESNLKSGEHGHVDISHTRRITEAFCEADYFREESYRAKIKDGVELFLRGVQRDTYDLRPYEGCQSRPLLPYDGGFVSSVVTLSTIKSQPVEIANAGYHYPSYATATCDGLMTMRMLGMQQTQAYTDAKKWLKQNQNFSTIDGLTHHPEQWDEIMHYYHLAVRSEAMNVADPYGTWRDSIEFILNKEIRPQGYFVNPIGGVNKEDDPLMATIFAIQALGNIRLHRKVISSTDLKIINYFDDRTPIVTPYPPPDTVIYAIKIAIQNLTKDTLFFAGTDSKLRVEIRATYPHPMEMLRHSHIGDYFGRQPYELEVYPLQKDTLIFYYDSLRPYIRMDIKLEYLINQEHKSAWAVLYK